MRRPALALSVLLALPGAGALARPSVVPLTLPSGKVLQTEVMVKDEDLQMGLMFRPSLPLDHGMLFVFAQPDFHGIWMKNCKFPIDILWLDDERKVVHVDENVPPCTARDDKLCEVYYPLRRAWYVVEINAGQARREKAVVGSSVKFTLPESSAPAACAPDRTTTPPARPADRVRSWAARATSG